jgi:hypothetical protein
VYKSLRWHAIGSLFIKLYVMKRYAAVCAFVLVALVTSSFSFAQTGTQMGDQATHAAQMKQKLVSELKMTDMQADSVVAINMSYKPQMRDIFQDQSLSQDEKKSRMRAITEQADKRIQPILGDSLFRQYQDWRMKNMQQMKSGKTDSNQ